MIEKTFPSFKYHFFSQSVFLLELLLGFCPADQWLLLQLFEQYCIVLYLYKDTQIFQTKDVKVGFKDSFSVLVLEVVLHYGRLPLLLSSIVVVFH